MGEPRFGENPDIQGEPIYGGTQVMGRAQIWGTPKDGVLQIYGESPDMGTAQIGGANRKRLGGGVNHLQVHVNSLHN